MYAQLNQDSVLISNEVLQKYTELVVELSVATAMKELRKENELKKEKQKLTVKQVAEEENISNQTVVNWITKGIKKGKIKLKAERKGERVYLIVRKDLQEFNRKKKEFNID